MGYHSNQKKHPAHTLLNASKNTGDGISLLALLRSSGNNAITDKNSVTDSTVTTPGKDNIDKMSKGKNSHWPELNQYGGKI